MYNIIHQLPQPHTPIFDTHIVKDNSMRIYFSKYASTQMQIELCELCGGKQQHRTTTKHQGSQCPRIFISVIHHTVALFHPLRLLCVYPPHGI